MFRSLRILVLAATLAAAPPGAAAGELALQAGSTLGLKGKSTMHAYEARASKLEVTFTADPALWPADASGGEAVERLMRARGVTAMTVVVPVAGLQSGKKGLDRNMVKALLAGQHPEIRYHMSSYEIVAGAASGEMTIHAKGVLTVAGVDQEITMAVKATRAGETVKLAGEVPLLMSQFKIKPPTMMMGALKTSDQITVHFNLVVGASGTSARAE